MSTAPARDAVRAAIEPTWRASAAPRKASILVTVMILHTMAQTQSGSAQAMKQATTAKGSRAQAVRPERRLLVCEQTRWDIRESPSPSGGGRSRTWYRRIGRGEIATEVATLPGHHEGHPADFVLTSTDPPIPCA